MLNRKDGSGTGFIVGLANGASCDFNSGYGFIHTDFSYKNNGAGSGYAYGLGDGSGSDYNCGDSDGFGSCFTHGEYYSSGEGYSVG